MTTPSSFFSNLKNSPPSFKSEAAAGSDAFSQSGSIESDFRTGAFNIGGSNTVNILFIVAGVITLAFVLREFIFKKK